jgi:hypothetical protein
MWDKSTEHYTVILSLTKFANYKVYFTYFDKKIFFYISINYPRICLNFLCGIFVSCWNILGSKSLLKTGYPESFRSFQNSFQKIPEKGHELSEFPFLR